MRTVFGESDHRDSFQTGFVERRGCARFVQTVLWSRGEEFWHCMARGAVERSVDKRSLRLKAAGRSLAAVGLLVRGYDRFKQQRRHVAARPYQTIQKAASMAGPGDTVYIEGGTYHGTVTPANSGSASAPITYMPYNNQQVTIDGAAGRR